LPAVLEHVWKSVTLSIANRMKFALSIQITRCSRFAIGAIQHPKHALGNKQAKKTPPMLVPFYHLCTSPNSDKAFPNPKTPRQVRLLPT